MSAHTCKQNTKITVILGLLALFLTLVGFAAHRSDLAARQSSDANKQVAANTAALNRLDGQDRDVAAMKRDIEWIKQALKDIKEKIK